jgi:dTMP kinase
MPLITFEGIEGSGKSTQARRAEVFFRERGAGVLLAREPGGTRIGTAIRKVLMDPENRSLEPLAELLLMEADRCQHVAEVIGPALERGTVVICDRFNDATIAYQGGGRGIDLAIVSRIDAWAVGAVHPDRTLLFDCPVEMGIARARARDGDVTGRFEGESLDFHRRVREAYLRIAGENPDRVRVIDTTRSPDEVFAAVVREITPLLGVR